MRDSAPMAVDADIRAAVAMMNVLKNFMIMRF